MKDEKMTIEQANEEMVAALIRAGIANARADHPPMAVRAARFDDKGWINVDLMRVDQHRRPCRRIKISMFAQDSGRSAIGNLIRVGRAVRNVTLEPGNQFEGTQECGVVYKLNTGVDWSVAATADFDRVANIVVDFVNQIAQVF